MGLGFFGRFGIRCISLGRGFGLHRDARAVARYGCIPREKKSEVLKHADQSVPKDTKGSAEAEKENADVIQKLENLVCALVRAERDTLKTSGIISAARSCSSSFIAIVGNGVADGIAV